MSQGLLSGVLPTIFEAGNRIKRYRNALLRDPIGNANALAESLAVDINDQMQAPQWRNSLLGMPFDPMAMRQEQNRLMGLFAGVGMAVPKSVTHGIIATDPRNGTVHLIRESKSEENAQKAMQSLQKKMKVMKDWQVVPLDHPNRKDWY